MPVFLPQTVEGLLQSMVRVPSVNAVVSGHPRAETDLADHNAQLATAMGFDVERLPVPGRADNLLIRCTVDPELPWIVLESHLDTVTAEGMTIAPFDGGIREGKLWGRGSCDTKGSAAAMLHAMRLYAGQRLRPHNVALLQTIDEEFGMTGVRAFVRDQLPRLGLVPRLILVGEPTGLKPVIAHNGCVRWRITTHGRAAHSSNPALGRSAISRMMHVVDLIESRYIPSIAASHPMTGKAQCSVNLIQGGQQINIIPDRCRIDIDRRVVPGENPATVLPEMDALLEELRCREPELPIEQEGVFECPPLPPQVTAGVLPMVQRALASLGLPDQPMGVGYATDAGDLGAAGLPALVLGPGHIAQAHTRDEFIDLDQLRRGVEVYFRILTTT
ncbi:MAG: M20 family metallopeptidase [Phycisphaeraceae bacterium]|nr:M20 family metallopeptidase [Phycisphaeraceae bacterium]